jgi:error-prone DNA polymerase
MPYIELHAKSAFSFLESASIPEALAGVCAEHGLPAMALLDRDGVYGAPRFHHAAKKTGIRALLGSEITLREAEHLPQRHRDTEDSYSQTKKQNSSVPLCLCGRFSHLPLLVASRAGYQNLCRLVTRMKLRAPKIPVESRPETIAAATLAEVTDYANGLICLTGGDEGPLAAALGRGGIEEAKLAAGELVRIFGRGNVYVELQRHFDRAEEMRNRALIEIARSLGLPLVATNGVRHATAADRELADVLTCIRTHNTLETAGRLLARNSERHIKSAAEMQQMFADLPEAIAATEEIFSRLEFTLADLGYEFPRYPVPDGETMMSFLRKRTDEGARNRYLARARVTQSSQLWTRARRQIERELALIEKLGLEGYFLIVWDIVQFCRREGILVQGRGSAANSAVCYSLGITAVDPIGMDLLFERFLSEERGEWPDIDLDLPSGDRRERVIQHVYERYGKLGAAMTANVITYRGRLAAREMGKALGFDAETTGRLSAMVGSFEYQDPNDTLERHFHEAGYDLRHPRMRKFFELCLAAQDLPRHLGQHSGGMVICQGQLDSVVPLEPASMPGRVVVQWDKDDCADMGIVKVDLLGLGMMAVLQDSLGIIRDNYGDEVDLAQLPPDDPAVYDALCKADTVGMFQIESRAQMSCLPRLRPKRFYDIVVQVAIIRPGPIVGNMVNPFIQRRLGREPVTYPHPALEPVLERTLGVPLFQEQLLRMAMITAGFSGGQAEELRRAFGFKRAEARMADVEKKLRAGMTHNGITGEPQEAIIHAITSFALYGFPESHAASFALLAYASAWLKTHHLAAFTAAMLNNQPMGFYHPATLVKDAQRHGLRVLPIDVLKSDWLCTLEKENPSQRQRDTEKNESKDPSSSVSLCLCGGSFALRLGLRYVRGMREEAAQALVAARRMRPFASIDELVRRVPELRSTELTTLAEIGALNSIGNRWTPAEVAGSVASGQWSVASESSQFSVLGSQNDANAHLSEGHGFSRAETAAFDNCHPERTSVREGSAVPLAADDPIAERANPFVTNDDWPKRMPAQRPPFGNSAIRQFGNSFHRRDALWQIACSTRRSGPLLDELDQPDTSSPLARMTNEERLVADFHGTGLTIGSHPMRYRRAALDAQGVVRAGDLERLPNGHRVRTAGCVICRQRPGTARGFVFLSLEDETGIANAIVTPDLFDRHRFLLVHEKFLLVEGPLQNLDGVISVKADRIEALKVTGAPTSSHDFH